AEAGRHRVEVRRGGWRVVGGAGESRLLASVGQHRVIVLGRPRRSPGGRGRSIHAASGGASRVVACRAVEAHVCHLPSAQHEPRERYFPSSCSGASLMGEVVRFWIAAPIAMTAFGLSILRLSPSSAGMSVWLSP